MGWRGRMAGKRDWLEAGLDILGEHGAPALTIERLTERLGLTKGSFYHHFKGMGGYKTALLAHIEAEGTAAYIAYADSGPDRSARARLDRLAERVSDDDRGPALEVAVRAWAQQDPEVRALQERVDRTRMAYLRDLWQEITGDPAAAEQTALLLYLVTIGADHLVPAASGRALRGLYDLVIRLGAGDRAP
ncbi:TetR/AcrR family transcriptional regulator, partial [Actinomadura kijaniata]